MHVYLWSNGWWIESVLYQQNIFLISLEDDIKMMRLARDFHTITCLPVKPCMIIQSVWNPTEFIFNLAWKMIWKQSTLEYRFHNSSYESSIHYKCLGWTTRWVGQTWFCRSQNQPIACHCGVRSTVLQTQTIPWLVKVIMNIYLTRDIHCNSHNDMFICEAMGS